MVLISESKCAIEGRLAITYAFIMVLTSLATCKGKFCGQWCTVNEPCNILDICMLNGASAPAIFMDSTLTPRTSDTTCFCLLEHDLGLESNGFQFYVQSHTNDGGGLQIEINESTFNSTSNQRKLTIGTQTYIKYSQTRGKSQESRLCLQISTDLEGFKGPNLTINCFPSDYATSPKHTTFKSNKVTSMDPNKDNSTGSNVTLRSTTALDTGNKKDQSSKVQSGIIAGSAGGGAGLLLSIAVLVVCLVRQRKHKRDAAEVEKNDEQAFDEPDYYMETNANYISADSLSQLPVNGIPNHHDENSAINNSVKMENKIVVESDYNHLNEVKPTHVTGNIYNTFESDKYNISKHPRGGNETNSADYDTLKKY